MGFEVEALTWTDLRIGEVRVGSYLHSLDDAAHCSQPPDLELFDSVVEAWTTGAEFEKIGKSRWHSEQTKPMEESS